MLCIAVIFLYACSSETPPENEVVTDDAEEMTAENNGEEILEETDTESGTSGSNESENSELEDISHSELEQESDAVSTPISGDITKIGYFTIETPKGEVPILNDDSTMTLPGGGTIITDNGTQFTVESGGVLYCDELNSPFKLSIHDSVRIASGDSDVIIESPNGVTISIDGMMIEEESTVEEERVSRNSPWLIYFDENQNAIFEFAANGVKCTSLDSVFPTYKNADNGTILFKKCTIELTDGTIIDAPLNTIAKINEGVFTIIIGMGEANMIKPDGTISAIPEGTVIDSNF